MLFDNHNPSNPYYKGIPVKRLKEILNTITNDNIIAPTIVRELLILTPELKDIGIIHIASEELEYWEKIMGPEELWKIIITEEYDKKQYIDAAINLITWIEKGGFPPKVTGKDRVDRFIVRSVCDQVLSNQRLTNENKKG